MQKWFSWATSAIIIGVILILLELVITDWWDKVDPTIPTETPIPEPEKPKTTNNIVNIPQQPIYEIEKPNNEPEPQIDPVTQLKHLHNQDSPIKVSLWLGEPGQKYFDSRKKVVIAYEVQGDYGTTAYLTLLNISPKGQISKMFSEKIEIGQKYEGKLRLGAEYVKRRETLLEKGQEYFKAIVSSEPLNDWRNFINGGTTEMNFWGTGEIMVNVVD